MTDLDDILDKIYRGDKSSSEIKQSIQELIYNKVKEALDEQQKSKS